MSVGEPERGPTNLFDRRAATFGRGPLAFFWEFGRLLADQVAVGPGVVVADVAAGTGAVAVPLARAGARVVALDVSAPMLAQLPESAGGLVVHRALASAQALPLPDAAVDALTCGFGVAFFPDPVGALAEMRRVLRPGGRAALSWWLYDVPTPHVAWQRITAELVDADAARRQRRQEELAAPGALARLARDAGLKAPLVRPLTVDWLVESVEVLWETWRRRWEADGASPSAAAQQEVRGRFAAAVAPWIT